MSRRDTLRVPALPSLNRDEETAGYASLSRPTLASFSAFLLQPRDAAFEVEPAPGRDQRVAHQEVFRIGEVPLQHRQPVQDAFVARVDMFHQLGLHRIQLGLHRIEMLSQFFVHSNLYAPAGR